MKEVLNNILDYMIQVENIAMVRQEKMNAVIRRDYNLAADLREEEVKLQKDLPSVNTFKEWKEELNK